MTQLEYLLCPLKSSGSHDMIQKRVQTFLRHVPSLGDNLLDAFSTLSMTTEVFTEEQVHESICNKTDLPVTYVEARSLAHSMVDAGGVSMDGMTALIAKIRSEKLF